MSAPTNKCPFKSSTTAGLACEGTDCMAYDTVNETCKILIAVEAMIQVKNGGIISADMAGLINNV